MEYHGARNSGGCELSGMKLRMQAAFSAPRALAFAEQCLEVIGTLGIAIVARAA